MSENDTTHTETGVAQPDNFMDGLKQNAARFEDEYDDLEAIIEGEIGFHAYFTSGGPDPTRGVMTAIYQGLYDVLEEVSIDAEIVEIHYGEVTPETTRKAVEDQLHEYTYLPENITDAIGDRVEKRVEKNLEQQPSDGPDGRLSDYE